MTEAQRKYITTRIKRIADRARHLSDGIPVTLDMIESTQVADTVPVLLCTVMPSELSLLIDTSVRR